MRREPGAVRAKETEARESWELLAGAMGEMTMPPSSAGGAQLGGRTSWEDEDPELLVEHAIEGAPAGEVQIRGARIVHRFCGLGRLGSSRIRSVKTGRERGDSSH